MKPPKNSVRLSGLAALAACPQKRRREEGLPDETSPLATAGNLIHSAMAGEKVTLTADQEQTAKQLEARANVILELLDVPEDAQALIEQRFVTMDGAYNGQPDIVYLWNHEGEARALVLDWKTGYIEVEESKKNLQLLGYSALVHQKYLVDVVYACIVQPFFDHNPVKYTDAKLREADKVIRGIIARSHDRLAPAVAGENQCRYCKARGGCQEAAQTAMAVVDYEPQLPANRVAELMRCVGVAKQIIPKIEARARELLEADPDALDGWELGPETERVSITDAGGVIESMSRHFPQIGAGNVLGKMTLTKSTVRDAVREATDLKGKDLAEKVGEILEGWTEKTTVKGRLKSVK